ncbi:protein of unknown function [Agreia sp. COWG]|nr:protein of unknown function [Agreia sp. COWG]
MVFVRPFRRAAFRCIRVGANHRIPRKTSNQQL